MDIEVLMPHTEALIFASERPLTLVEMTSILGQALETVIETERIQACLEAISEKYAASYYPFCLSLLRRGVATSS